MATNRLSQPIRQSHHWLNLRRIAHDHDAAGPENRTGCCLRRGLPRLIYEKPSKTLRGKISKHAFHRCERRRDQGYNQEQGGPQVWNQSLLFRGGQQPPAKEIHQGSQIVAQPLRRGIDESTVKGYSSHSERAE